ncbi:GntR family transcriptional regulator [Bacillus safensis]|uniref:GntR family transcriptional regulator n=1 Tax=Bacillus TaxID=1386 RepID=UPI00041AACED|nr:MULTISPECIES: GntR family transcriptional regulator [Bacillus]MBW4853377.1 GntR family transcriptional regulator [Bacillaceae bacterium]MBW4856059.1 GntR family transcriptional regulator [Bacillaceae bacterium]MCY7582532.1 GntR family transcriptional regulator [Bacillus safensis]MCY7586498.1 GntR family transcriptional regulator [Bacillus safensis]MCY7609963.1 GntR family transcriptional regulator [Bacillus safensis]
MLKYQQIASDIEKYIVTHEMQQGDKLPVLETLMSQFAVSKSTIIKSLELLEKKGIIYQVRGSGIFVRRHRRKGYISLLSNQGFKKDLEEFQLTSEVLMLDTIKPSEEAALNLNIEQDEDVFYLKRIRYINGQTLCLEESYYRKTIIPYLNTEIAADSVFKFVSEGLGLKVGFSDMYLQVGKLNETEATHLGLKQDDPALRVETVFHLTNGQPFDFSKITYNYMQSQFFIQANNYYG